MFVITVSCKHRSEHRSEGHSDVMQCDIHDHDDATGHRPVPYDAEVLPEECLEIGVFGKSCEHRLSEDSNSRSCEHLLNEDSSAKTPSAACEHLLNEDS